MWQLHMRLVLALAVTPTEHGARMASLQPVAMPKQALASELLAPPGFL